MIKLAHKILVSMAIQLEKNMNSLLKPFFDKYSLGIERDWSQKEKDAFFRALFFAMPF